MKSHHIDIKYHMTLNIILQCSWCIGRWCVIHLHLRHCQTQLDDKCSIKHTHTHQRKKWKTKNRCGWITNIMWSKTQNHNIGQKRMYLCSTDATQWEPVHTKGVWCGVLWREGARGYRRRPCILDLTHHSLWGVIRKSCHNTNNVRPFPLKKERRLGNRMCDMRSKGPNSRVTTRWNNIKENLGKKFMTRSWNNGRLCSAKLWLCFQSKRVYYKPITFTFTMLGFGLVS